MLFEKREFETPPVLGAASGSSPDTIRAAIKARELEAHNFGSRTRPSWKVSKEAWEAYLKLKSNFANAKGPRTRTNKKKSTVSVKEYV